MNPDANMDAQRARPVELRTGAPYARLIHHQGLFSQQVAGHFDLDAERVIPTAGTTGAIEAVRNHVLKSSHAPSVLTVAPGYWRAWEAFLGVGYRIVEVGTEKNGFTIDEEEVVERVAAEAPDLLYLSLPNNPTGATFRPERIAAHVSERTTILLDLTLPSRDFDAGAALRRLSTEFEGRRNLFMAGSLSKSHGAAEYRIGWLVCASRADARELRAENRNVVSTLAIEEGIRRLKEPPSFIFPLPLSHALLKEGEKEGRYEIVRPRQRVESGYVLIRLSVDIEVLTQTLAARGILVMWGSECGLNDRYVRLEMLEPANVEQFVRAINSCPVAPAAEAAPKLGVQYHVELGYT